MRMFVKFKLCQAVLAIALLCEILDMHKFCGEFVAPKAFFNSADVSSEAGHCEGFTLIALDSVTGDYGAVSDKHKWYMHLLMTNSTTAFADDERQQKLLDQLASTLPAPGRRCIPITFSLLELMDCNRNHLQKVVALFALQLVAGLCSLIIICLQIVNHSRRYEPDELGLLIHALYWLSCVVLSSVLLLNWTNLWRCTNFRADIPKTPLITLILSSMLVGSSLAEMCFSFCSRAKKGIRRAHLAVIVSTQIVVNKGNEAVRI